MTVGVPKAIALLQDLTPLCVRLAVVCPFDGGVRHHGRLLAVLLSSLSDERLKIAFHKLMGLPTLYQLVCQEGVDSAHGPRQPVCLSHHRQLHRRQGQPL